MIKAMIGVKVMTHEYKSIFDIIGPVMVGPSSSHTAGAVKIGLMARSLFNKQPEKVLIYLYGSFAKTFKGHGTDIALVGGLLNMQPNDERLHQSLQLAKQHNMTVAIVPLLQEKTEYPNTAKIIMSNANEKMTVVGVSVGGGKARITQINHIETDINDDLLTLIIMHKDVPGMIYKVSKIISDYDINIATMKVRRDSKGADAIMIIEVDTHDMSDVVSVLKTIENIKDVKVMDINKEYGQ